MRIYHDADGQILFTLMGDQTQNPEGDFIEVPDNPSLDISAHRVVDGVLVGDDTNRRAAWREVATMPRDLFAVECIERDWITREEALSWLAGNAVPAVAQTAIDAITDPAAKIRAEVSVFAQGEIRRISSLVLAIQAQEGIADEDLDDAFGYVAVDIASGPIPPP